MPEMLKMHIHQDAVEHPIPCSECGRNAAVLLFERIAPAGPPVTLHLRKKSAKCWSHLTMEENAVRCVTTA